MLLAALLLALQEADAAPTARKARGWDDFPVFVWRETYAGNRLPEELVEPFGGVILMRDEDSSWARERGLSYLVWNVAGRDALHLDADEAWNQRVEQWIETHDEKLLVREPCLNDPETVEELFATLDRTIAKHGEYPGLGFVLGDEVGLTPNGDPFDLCRCGLCEAKWREHAEENGLPERAPLTDEVRLALLEDDFALLGPWLARRRFDRQELHHLVLRIRERALGKPDPSPTWPRRYSSGWDSRIPMGLLGSRGASAFGGLDLTRLGDLFNFLEFYPVVDARESFSTLAHRPHPSTPGSSRGGFPGTLATIFLDQETPDGCAWRAWEHWLRGGRGLVLWSDASLERRPEHLARLSQAVGDIRALGPQRLVMGWYHGGALVTDEDSVAVSFLRDALLDGPTWPRRTAGYQAQHGTRERKVASWLRWIEDAGQLPAVLRLDALGRDCVHEYGFLVLPEILVVDEKDLPHLEEFVDEGGILYVDGDLGWVDSKGMRRSEDLFERLHARAPDRVRRPPAAVRNYLEIRSTPAAQAVRIAAKSEIEACLGVRRRINHPGTDRALIPDLGREAGGVPWLVARGAKPQGTETPVPVLVLLPNFPSPDDRRKLRDLELQLSPEEGTWIRPLEGQLLEAGDAAVLIPKSIRPPPKLK